MVKGKSITYLTREFILTSVSEYDIYRYYTGRDFKLNKAFNSPFRNDPVASFLIGTKFDNLYHIDFGDSRYRGSCFDFVMQLYNLNYYQALQRVAKDFGLIGNSTREAPVYKQPVKVKQQYNTIIQVVPKSFTISDIKYWNDYTIDISDLKSENIYSIGKLYINKKRVHIPTDEIAFGYLYGEYWKIYRPHNKDKKNKWRSNVPIDTVDGLENIHNCEKSVVTKSKKDKLVIRKIFSPTCHVQNESVVAFSKETVTYLQTEGGIVYCAFDNDPPGKRASMSVTSEFGFKHINVPDGWGKKGLSDFADLTREKGLDKMIAHFKRKGLL